ncbi:patatin-like phospholipase family protein [Sabulicella glaciei]|uniref:Patatin-like phospholipase family protein n=1 Tax=Sabulicella glaciei TaxID=2984948 RepID=A0ABT3P0T6_9PROT|nr:patatin-like phospholipase family protein [Roseococcus sp. MDT2-1-1]MCW8088027.1 patatin-like phospholipase family protein [Roseococcus sp. MDT2-1-1]
MPLDPDLMPRFLSATPTQQLRPFMHGGPPRTRSIGDRLREDLENPVYIQGPGNRRYRQVTVARDVAQAIVGLIGAQPRRSDILVDLFAEGNLTAGRGVEAFRQTYAETFLLAVTLLPAGGPRLADLRVDEIARILSSASPAGKMLREALTYPGRQPAPVDPIDGGPGFSIPPGIPPELLVAAERFAAMGCAAATRTAFGRWGAGVAAAAPRYLENAITDLQPRDGCVGEEIRIVGAGFGAGVASGIVFSGLGGSPILVPANDVLQWSDQLIRVRIPAAARRGPVGVVTFPTGGGPLGDLGAQVIGEVQACFGPAVMARIEQIIGNFITPPIGYPPVQANMANMFLGGPPIIETFSVSPGRTLHPGQTVKLTWSVIGATRIEIVALAVPGSAPHELPAIPAPLAGAEGFVEVVVPGTTAWRGIYALRASNRCTGAGPAVEHQLEFEMVFRRGLALGGGGARGDFQAGALEYLYNERGYRPQAIAATSVGAINAIELLMGDDDPPVGGGAAVSAASRLGTTWRLLVDETSMFLDQPWLANARPRIRRLIRSLSVEGVMALPYTIVGDAVVAGELASDLGLDGSLAPSGAFSLAPIEVRARATFQQDRVNANGIALRLATVSLETGEVVQVNERGEVQTTGPQPVRPYWVQPPPVTDVIDGAIASSTMPAVFSARRLGDHMCVDGGIRDVVPVNIAIRDLGCNEVIAIRCSAPPALQETNPRRSLAEALARSVLGIVFDELADNDVSPFSGWGPNVQVLTIQPNIDLHDTIVVEPGLIHIGMDYGWMRAADILAVPAASRARAIALSDQIAHLRSENWRHAHWANGLRYQDPHRSFTDFAFSNMMPPASNEIQPTLTPEAIDAIRGNCRIIRDALAERSAIRAPNHPARNQWFTQWEIINGAALTADPWAAYVSEVGDRLAEPPPAPV